MLLTSLLLSVAATTSDRLEEIVVTANRTDQSIAEITSSIAIVDEDRLQATSHTHINEVMFNVPGVWISRGNGQEHLTAIRSPVLTGAGGCGAFYTAQDGIQIRASGFCNVNELFEAHSEVADRIEVLKGPGSVMHGSNAMHGVINILTPDPGEHASTYSAEAGSYDYQRLKVSESRESWRVDASATSNGGYKDDAGFDQQKVTLKFARDLGNFSLLTGLTLTNLNQETAGFVEGVKAYEDGGLRRDNPNPEAYRDAKSLRLYTSVKGGDWVVTPYVRWVDMVFRQHFLPGQPLEENAHRSVGIQSSWYVSANWTVGLDAERTHGRLEESQQTTIGFSDFLNETIPVGDHYDYQVDATTVATFARYDRNLSDRTTLSAGARFEWVEYDYNNNMIVGSTRDNGIPCGFGGCRFSRPADRSDSFTNISPRIGITHSINPGSQLYARVSRGFRAPQTSELYRLQAGQSVSNIDSEQLDAFEIGLRGQRGTLTYDLAAYWMDKDNFIFRDNSRIQVDNGETRHRGLDLGLTWQMAPGWTARFNAAFADHEYSNNPALATTDIKGNEIDTAPKTIGSAVLQWQANARWQSEMEWVHMGDYYTNPQNTAEYEGHDLVNVRIRYQYSPSLDLSLRIQNLLNTDYAERADFAFGNERYFVGQPTSVYLGLTYRR